MQTRQLRLHKASAYFLGTRTHLRLPILPLPLSLDQSHARLSYQPPLLQSSPLLSSSLSASSPSTTSHEYPSKKPPAYRQPPL
jgi:hypothetical protein